MRNPFLSLERVEREVSPLSRWERVGVRAGGGAGCAAAHGAASAGSANSSGGD